MVENVKSERLNQICTDYDSKKILSKILFFNPSSLREQEKMIKNATKIKDLGLVVLDTYNLFYRLTLEEDDKFAIRSLNRQITDLQIAAMKKDLFAIISGQVYSVENDDVKPFAGRGIEHVAKTIIKLQKIGIGRRQATIIKHRSLPEGEKAVFTITSKGIQ